MGKLRFWYKKALIQEPFLFIKTQPNYTYFVFPGTGIE
jgi:hypothetical protein